MEHSENKCTSLFSIICGPLLKTASTLSAVSKVTNAKPLDKSTTKIHKYTKNFTGVFVEN
jgi:hypothetical protein